MVGLQSFDRQSRCYWFWCYPESCSTIWIINQTILLFLVLDTAKWTSLHLLWSELILDHNSSRPQSRKTITKIVSPSWSIQLASASWWVSRLILWTNVCPSFLWGRDWNTAKDEWRLDEGICRGASRCKRMIAGNCVNNDHHHHHPHPHHWTGNPNISKPI